MTPGRSAAWLARLLWEQEVPSSNLGAPTFHFALSVIAAATGPQERIWAPRSGMMAPTLAAFAVSRGCPGGQTCRTSKTHPRSSQGNPKPPRNEFVQANPRKKEISQGNERPPRSSLSTDGPLRLVRIKNARLSRSAQGVGTEIPKNKKTSTRTDLVKKPLRCSRGTWTRKRFAAPFRPIAADRSTPGAGAWHSG